MVVLVQYIVPQGLGDVSEPTSDSLPTRSCPRFEFFFSTGFDFGFEPAFSTRAVGVISKKTVNIVHVPQGDLLCPWPLGAGTFVSRLL